MVRGNRRDTKFLIFQSLYIIAISILFYKGTDLSLNKVSEINPGDTVVNITVVPSPNDTVVSKTLEFYDSQYQEVLRKPDGDTVYKAALSNDTIINRNVLKAKDIEIANLKNLKTPKQFIPPEQEKASPKPNIKGLRKK